MDSSKIRPSPVSQGRTLPPLSSVIKVSSFGVPPPPPKVIYLQPLTLALLRPTPAWLKLDIIIFVFFFVDKSSTRTPVFYRISENEENEDYMDDDDENDDGGWRSVELPKEKNKSGDYVDSIELPNGDDINDRTEIPKVKKSP